jgi:ERCC4-type nuclease
MSNIITIDQNEATHHPEFMTFTWDDCLVCSALLPCGDFRIDMPDATILIERKAPGDLLESVKDRRLFNQVTEMLAITPWTYIVIHGVIIPTEDGVEYKSGGKWQKRDWSWASIQGVFTSLQEQGAVIVQDTDIQGAISRIMNRSRDTIKVPPRRDTYVFSPAESFLMAIPGIGSDKAQKLSEIFTVPGFALEWLTSDDPTYIPGIGEKTRQGVREFLGGIVTIQLEATNE